MVREDTHHGKGSNLRRGI